MHVCIRDFKEIQKIDFQQDHFSNKDLPWLLLEVSFI